MVVVTSGAASVGAHERPCQLQSQNGQQVALTFVEVEPMSTESVTTEAASIPCALPWSTLSTERTCQRKKENTETASAPLKERV